ncbi:neurofilament medium polypeptide-like isoform X1 [Oenanthe melanoleuca]|uniref:neurofilament medium polypeptide-like isoform X1 n=1 Tax=Oenanthe melanoleuca TaxID=2939378 RepID=UPI0024C16DDD|nr:neurofilament medium polypeptide-like isoform X1 [Oenanthe melanoleuca]
MALALRLFLLLLLAVALPARAAQAAPWPARGADEWAENVDPAAWVDESFDHLTFPEGSPSWDYPDVGDKKSLEASELLDKMLSDLERRRAMKQKNVQMLAYPRGSKGSVPTPDEGKEEMAGKGSGAGEALGKSDTDVKNPSTTPRVFCPQDVRKSCMIGTVVTLFTVPLSMVLCYVGFQWWKGRKHRRAAAPASRRRRRDSPSPPESPRTTWFDSSQTRPQPQKPPRKAEHQPSVPPPRPPSSAVKQKPPEIPPPPPLPSQPPWSR